MMSNGRRPKIRAPRKNAATEVDFDEQWSTRLAPAIHEIQHKNSSQLSFEALYRAAYTLVLKKFGKKLYEEVRNSIKIRLKTEIIPEIGHMLVQASPIEVLREVDKIWRDHCLCTRMISDILMYMDRVYSRDAGLPLVYDTGLILFRDALTRNDYNVADYLYKTIINEIQRERRGEIIDRLTIKNTVNMLEALPSGNRIDSESLYLAEFEPLLETASREFFEEAGENILAGGNEASAYMRKIKQWLDEEKDRANMYLPQTTSLKVVPIIENVLISGKIGRIIDNPTTGFTYLCDNNKTNELQLLFQLVGRVDNNYACIKDALVENIERAGKEINHYAEQLAIEAKEAKAKGDKERAQNLTPTAISINWVFKVLETKKKYDDIISSSFHDSRPIRSAYDAAFSKLVNENKKVSEYLSLFVDEHLKRTLKGKTDTEIEEVLEQALTLFRYISDKDLFEMYYKTHLAKRLLSGKSVSEEAEKSFIGKIQREAGTAFTSKLEGMFRDMRTSKDTMSKFRTAKQNGKISVDIELNVNVLTSTYWPSGVNNTSMTSCVLPKMVQDAKNTFEEFYLSRHSGRILSWNPALGTADVRARFKKRVHDINMPTLAMCILLLFNDVEDDQFLTYDDIKQATNVSDQELQRHLLSIAVAPRTRLLKKEPMSKEIKETDKFYLNDKFESPMTRIKVLAVSSTNKIENDAERKNTMGKLQETRKFEIDAAIVRVMKARKSMEHASLVATVTQQLASRFRPDPMMIKKQVDSLMEREYIERDSKEKNVYNYLA